MCVYTYIYIYMYIYIYIYTHISSSAPPWTQRRSRRTPASRSHSSIKGFHCIFKDRQTYPKRFLPELKKTQQHSVRLSKTQQHSVSLKGFGQESLRVGLYIHDVLTDFLVCYMISLYVAGFPCMSHDFRVYQQVFPVYASVRPLVCWRTSLYITSNPPRRRWSRRAEGRHGRRRGRTICNVM